MIKLNDLLHGISEETIFRRFFDFRFNWKRGIAKVL